MNLFFNRPQWYTALPPHLRPPKNKVRELENYRKSLGLDDQVFFVMVGGTKWATIKAITASRDQLRHDLPEYSETDLWKAVITIRLSTRLSLASQTSAEEERLQKRMETLDETVSNMRSWDEVVDHCLELDKSSLQNDPAGIKHQITEIIMS